MSGGLDVLALKEEDVVKFIACSSHLGANQCDFQVGTLNSFYLRICSFMKDCRWSKAMCLVDRSVEELNFYLHTGMLKLRD